MQRQGKRAAIVFVVLSLALLAVHHAGLHAAHDAGGGVAAAAMHHGHDTEPAPAQPADGGDGMVAVCLAVLPLVALFAVAAALLMLPWWPIARGPRARVVRAARAWVRPPRAGPRLLCVMRC